MQSLEWEKEVGRRMGIPFTHTFFSIEGSYTISLIIIGYSFINQLYISHWINSHIKISFDNKIIIYYPLWTHWPQITVFNYTNKKKSYTISNEKLISCDMSYRAIWQHYLYKNIANYTFCFQENTPDCISLCS